ncbi:MAG: hypothetical protein JXR25_00980 [Pontiellaceae bacterium]|nr:hypothetical protein [Pontiellaceae bacterium]MBN2783373.1 hypothetical protein [Pontiellaceae bacterium]
MSRKIPSRVVPISVIAIALLAMLILCEILIMGGFLEVRASTVARIAPWATESFLKLVGDHPDSPWRIRKNAPDAPGPSTMDVIAGFDPNALLSDSNDVPDEIESPGLPDEPSDVVVPEVVDDNIPVG